MFYTNIRDVRCENPTRRQFYDMEGESNCNRRARKLHQGAGMHPVTQESSGLTSLAVVSVAFAGLVIRTDY
jgi:hypothetical protein